MLIKVLSLRNKGFMLLRDKMIYVKIKRCFGNVNNYLYFLSDLFFFTNKCNEMSSFIMRDLYSDSFKLLCFSNKSRRVLSDLKVKTHPHTSESSAIRLKYTSFQVISEFSFWRVFFRDNALYWKVKRVSSAMRLWSSGNCFSCRQCNFRRLRSCRARKFRRR